jgi:MbtH protein
MTATADGTAALYKVVLNHEEQYSIWRTDREDPPGWRDEGTTGTEEECLAHIERVWTDMRPLSLRRRMDERAAAAAGADGGEACDGAG